MKILITGATGGLGLALVEKLLGDNHEIIACGRDEKRGAILKNLGATFIPIDLVKINDFAPLLFGVEIIVHAAALSSPWGRREDFAAINFEATRKLFEAAKSSNIKSFIFISTPSIYCGPFARLSIDENTIIYEKHLNHYAITKLMAENYISKNSAGISAIILRPRAIIGPYDNVLLPRFLRLIRRGRFPFFNGGEAQIELTDVRDVATAIDLCIKNYRKLDGETFNISGGKSMTIKELVAMLSDAMKEKVRYSNIAFNSASILIKLLEYIFEKLPNRPEPILTYYGLCALSFSQTFNLSKAQNILGYSPAYDAFKSAKEIAIKVGKKK